MPLIRLIPHLRPHESNQILLLLVREVLQILQRRRQIGHLCLLLLLLLVMMLLLLLVLMLLMSLLRLMDHLELLGQLSLHLRAGSPDGRQLRS